MYFNCIFNFKISFRKEIEFAGHQSAVLALSVNSAGDVVASGDEKGKIILWDERLKKLHHFSEHKKAITGNAYTHVKLTCDSVLYTLVHTCNL